MEILNYDEQRPGGSTVAIFSVSLSHLTIHRVRLIKTKKGHMMLGLPSYAVDQPDGSKKWHQYLEWSTEKGIEFEKKVMQALEPFLRK